MRSSTTVLISSGVFKSELILTGVFFASVEAFELRLFRFFIFLIMEFVSFTILLKSLLIFTASDLKMSVIELKNVELKELN
jgi:hypothetical protein